MQPRINLNAISFPYSVLTGIPWYLLLHASLYNPCNTGRSVAVTERRPPCEVARIPQSRYLDGEPNGSISTIAPRFSRFECKLRNLHASFSENSHLFVLFNIAEFFASSKADGFTSFMKTFSIVFNSFATRILRAPIPERQSRKVLGPLKFCKNVEYATMEKSLPSLALGLKNAGCIGGAFVSSDSFGTRSFVSPSIISTMSCI